MSLGYSYGILQGCAPLSLATIVIASLSRSSAIPWLYFSFVLSFRDVEEMLAMRGVTLSYETIREWCLKFGQAYAKGLRHKSPRPGDQWHLDEMFPRDQWTHSLLMASSGSGW
jgi:hypothetical protein